MLPEDVTKSEGMNGWVEVVWVGVSKWAIMGCEVYRKTGVNLRPLGGGWKGNGKLGKGWGGVG